MSGKTALVLGATGKVGVALTTSLIEDGWKVHGAARASDEARCRAYESTGASLIRYDVTTGDPSVLPDVDVLFLEVWDPKQPDLIWPINFHGVGRVVERYAGIADVVNGCTIGLYGSSADPSSEDTPPRPDTDYGRSRYAQERLIDYFCQRGGKRGIHVRYAHANWAEYGVVRRTAEAVAEGGSLGTNPDAKIQVIGYEDFVRVTHLSVTRLSDPPTCVNCCHPRVWTQRGLAEALHERLGRGEVVFDRETGGEEQSVYADVSRMVEWFGEPTVSVEMVLERVVEAVAGEEA
ncbi:MAG: NAD-dependent epimerase/dehydratase family protein [Candidatus Latescibacteria bacterium]|jgi:nucleoside-diphosphate-sugar epimerase|nr:NAD-dependent epimerase/dehydratase family protein [Candidatus Latescibacterota bacterium]